MPTGCMSALTYGVTISAVCTFCKRPARKHYALARRSAHLVVYRSQRRPVYQTPAANTARAAIEPPTTASANDKLPDDPEASAGD